MKCSKRLSNADTLTSFRFLHYGWYKFCSNIFINSLQQE